MDKKDPQKEKELTILALYTMAYNHNVKCDEYMKALEKVMGEKWHDFILDSIYGEDDPHSFLEDYEERKKKVN